VSIRLSDSAIHYARENLKIAYELDSKQALSETKLILASSYSIAGMFIESLDLLQSIDKKNLTYELLVNYYDTYKLLYGYYAQNNFYTSGYVEKSTIYRDSLLRLLDTSFSHYKIVYAEKLYDQNRLKEAKKILLNLLSQSQEENHERAILAYALANVYKKEDNTEMQKKYYTISAICDIKNNIKENASLQALASILYDTVRPAYCLIRKQFLNFLWHNVLQNQIYKFYTRQKVSCLFHIVGVC